MLLHDGLLSLCCQASLVLTTWWRSTAASCCVPGFPRRENPGAEAGQPVWPVGQSLRMTNGFILLASGTSARPIFGDDGTAD